MRKIIAIFVAVFLFNTGAPMLSFAKEKKKKKNHITHRERRHIRKEVKEIIKLYEQQVSRANDFRLKAHARVGVHMFKRQTHKLQKIRSKNHLKP